MSNIEAIDMQNKNSGSKYPPYNAIFLQKGKKFGEQRSQQESIDIGSDIIFWHLASLTNLLILYPSNVYVSNQV